MKGFVLAPDAALDMVDIWEYIAADNAGAADRFPGKLHDQILNLRVNPGLGHSRDDLAGGRAILFCPVGEYLILYRSTPGSIQIVAIVHGKRDIPRFLHRRRIE